MLRIAGAGILIMLLAGCGGDGGGAANSSANSPNAPSGSVVLAGRVTFERVPFNAVSGTGLDFARSSAAPVRGATVEIIAGSGGAILASGVTGTDGAYNLTVAPNTEVFVRVKAELARAGAPSWSFSVRDNTVSDALYALDGAVFNSGSTSVTRNLHAASGWNGSGYGAPRSAAPFSVLDAVYESFQLVLSVSPSAQFPPLQILWSPNNRPVAPVGNTAAAIQAQLAQGNIGTSFYGGGSPARLYVLGDASIDSDEFDVHVVAHEWGHYYQDVFSREDSPGGEHAANQRLDYRVAFAEGWSNAFSAMVHRNPHYRDSFVSAGAQRDFGIDVENNFTILPGAYNEASVQSVIYDFFDADNDGADRISLGFAPLHAAMSDGVRQTAALTTLYPFLRALRAAQTSQLAPIDALTMSQSMVPASDDFAVSETNDGGDSRNLPVFQNIALGQTARVCSIATNGTYNRLGNRKFLRLDLPAPTTVTIRALNGPAGSDPDLSLFSAGVLRGTANGTTSGSETLTVSGLAAGTHIIEAFEYSNTQDSPRGETCFDLQISAG